MMTLMLITNDPDLACFAVECGVNRIFVDLEVIGKKERQGHLDTIISGHSIGDLSQIRQRLPHTDLLVRINPVHAASRDEVEKVLAAGANLVMLPMFRQVEELCTIAALIDGRAGFVPLIETPEAVAALPRALEITGITEWYIGLNDLHLGLGCRFMFEPLASGILDEMATLIRSHNRSFGFGGIARVGEGLLPGEMVLAEHIRLSSSTVILSRTFHRRSKDVTALRANLDFRGEIAKLRLIEEQLAKRSVEEVERDRQKVKNAIVAIADNISRRLLS